MKMSAVFFLLALAGGSLWASGASMKNDLITPEKAKMLLDTDKTVVLLDVRTPEEFSTGHIRGALLLPYDGISATTAAQAIPTKNTPVIVYCRSGRRSAIAAKTLMDLGYRQVLDLGGVNTWPYGLVR